MATIGGLWIRRWVKVVGWFGIGVGVQHIPTSASSTDPHSTIDVYSFTIGEQGS